MSNINTSEFSIRPIRAGLNAVLHSGAAILIGGTVDSYFPYKQTTNGSSNVGIDIVELAVESVAAGLLLNLAIELAVGKEDPLGGAFLTVPLFLSMPNYMGRINCVVSQLNSYINGIFPINNNKTTSPGQTSTSNY